MKQPALLFEFSNNRPVYFERPLTIYKTDHYDEVESVLHNVQDAVRDGYYAAGFISYEATYAFLKMNVSKTATTPLIWFGIFESPNTIPNFPAEDFHIGAWREKITKERYKKVVEHIVKEIDDGQFEQINYTTPFQARFSGNAYRYYEQLKRAQKSNFNAYLHIDDFHVLSVSPELFFQMKDDSITVRPMKGTIHRGKTTEEDDQLRDWLFHSEKNRLENDIITNLMKAELSTIASNIQIIDQYKIEKYPTVYQMTTTLKANLKRQINEIELLKTLFPCGSISGVPKKQSIEKIAEVEQEAREIYTGAIGYITPHKEAIFNVPIRTVVINEKQQIATYFAGGAITKNSHPDEEYAEMIAKTNVLYKQDEPFHLLETILLEDGNFFLIERHLTRLMQSARYFSIPISITSIKERLERIKNKHRKGNWRIRLTIDRLGEVSTETSSLKSLPIYNVTIAKTPVDTANVFLYHKTTERSVFKEHLSILPDSFVDVILWNERKEVTEFTIGNIVIERNGKRYTPPISSGLLAGTFREQLLSSGEIEEKIIYVDDLRTADTIWLINSVRRWVKVHLEMEINDQK